jgi:O-antigen polymerase
MQQRNGAFWHSINRDMIKTDSKDFDFFLLTGLTVILIMLAPLYYHPNLGGRGLELTFNISTWAAALCVVASAIYLITQRKTILLPRQYLYFIAVPVVIILNNLITGTSQPVPFFFRELFIIGGLLFFFALFQYRLKPFQLEWVLLAIVLSTLVHSTIGTVQVIRPEIFGNWFATQADSVPRGIFQQINVQVSFLATGVAIAMYLLSRPLAKRFNPLLSSLVILSIGLSSFVIVYSGSRVGLLSLTISVLLLLLFRGKQLSHNKILVLCAIVAIASGSIAGRGGMESSFAKTTNIAQGVSGDARLNMYSIAAELITQKPILGHGIGNYLRVWNLQTGDYFSRHPDATLPPYVTHPHNELVYWLIEGGIVIVSGILAAIVAVIMGLVRCGPRRAAGYIAILLPITLHTQVELPFYISSVHWFLWLFLIFMVMRHQVFSKALEASTAAIKLIQASCLVAFLGCLYFLQHTSRAQADMWNYVNHQEGSSSRLEIALSNHYFGSKAEQLGMRASLYNAVAANNPEQIRQYVEWATHHLEIRPDLKLFEDLNYAFTHLNDRESQCKVIQLGMRMYPHNQPLRELNQHCVN